MTTFIVELIDDQDTSFGFVIFNNTSDSILSPVFGCDEDAEKWLKGYNARLKK